MKALDLSNSERRTLVDDELAALIASEGIRLRITPQGYAGFDLAVQARRAFLAEKGVTA